MGLFILLRGTLWLPKIIVPAYESVGGCGPLCAIQDICDCRPPGVLEGTWLVSGRSFYAQFLRWWWGSKQKCPKGGGSWVSLSSRWFQGLSRLLGGPPACLGPAPLPASSFQEGVYLTGQAAGLTYALGRLHACQARPGTCSPRWLPLLSSRGRSQLFHLLCDA